MFYAERDRLPEEATEFVRDVVYPLLERGDRAMSDVVMTTALRSFLASVPAPCLIADFPADLQLLRQVLGGFELSDLEAAACGPIPRPILSRLIEDGITGMVIEDWFASNPDQACRRHHALVDAMALRTACLAISGGIEVSWSTTLTS